MSALDLDALERRARKGLVLSPDETLALITRLRAAEARTAWQPIASVPIGETVMLWTPVRRIHVGHVTTLARCEYTAWAPLPAAPEAPHV